MQINVNLISRYWTSIFKYKCYQTTTHLPISHKLIIYSTCI